MAAAAEYYGACKLCDCRYMGSVNNACQCSHPSSQHVPLEACTKTDCDCQAYDSPAGYLQCYNCLHDSDSHGSSTGNKEYNQLRVWVAHGIQQKEMVSLYQTTFNEPISLRALQRKLQNYELRSVDRDIADEQILEAVRIENANGILGYQQLYRILRTKHNLLIHRDRLHELIRHDDSIPKGKDPKLLRKYHQKPFVSKGPNWLWSADGHEKLAQPFGLYIYGLIDTFSRKALSLKVLPNKKADTIAHWLISEINSIQGVPKTIMIDKGTEWNVVVPRTSVIQVVSPFNQKIEAFWHQLLSHSDIPKYKQVLRDLERDGLFNCKVEKQRWALWMAFHSAVQKSLNQFRENYNSHTIRKQKNVDLPTGYSPDIMYSHPEVFSTESYLTGLDEEMENVATDEVAKKFPIPEDLQLRTLTASKDDCLTLYHEIYQSIC